MPMLEVKHPRARSTCVLYERPNIAQNKPVAGPESEKSAELKTFLGMSCAARQTRRTQDLRGGMHILVEAYVHPLPQYSKQLASADMNAPAAGGSFSGHPNPDLNPEVHAQEAACDTAHSTVV